MFKRKIFRLIYVILIFGSQFLYADEVKTEKDKLIDRYFKIACNNMQFEKMFKAYLKQSISILSSRIMEDSKKYAPDNLEKQLLYTKIMEKVLKIYPDITYEKIQKEIPIDRIFEDSFRPILDKQFTEDELREIVAFYGSKTGQKLTNVIPGLYESMFKILNTKYKKQIEDIAKSSLKEALLIEGNKFKNLVTVDVYGRYLNELEKSYNQYCTLLEKANKNKKLRNDKVWKDEVAVNIKEQKVINLKIKKLKFSEDKKGLNQLMQKITELNDIYFQYLSDYAYSFSKSKEETQIFAEKISKLDKEKKDIADQINSEMLKLSQDFEK